MPAAPITDSILVHSAVGLDVGTLETLKAEAFLLVHGCTASATRDEIREYDKDGVLQLLLKVRPRMQWAVSADALALAGLADYHPGAELGPDTLEFLNGSRKPFEFAEGGRFIYEEPTQDPGEGGALVKVAFRVSYEFAGRMETPPDSADRDTIAAALTTSFGSAYDAWLLSHPALADPHATASVGDPGDIGTATYSGPATFTPAWLGGWLGRRVAAWRTDGLGNVLGTAPYDDQPCDVSGDFTLTLVVSDYLWILY